MRTPSISCLLLAMGMVARDAMPAAYMPTALHASPILSERVDPLCCQALEPPLISDFNGRGTTHRDHAEHTSSVKNALDKTFLNWHRESYRWEQRFPTLATMSWLARYLMIQHNPAWLERPPAAPELRETLNRLYRQTPLDLWRIPETYTIYGLAWIYSPQEIYSRYSNIVFELLSEMSVRRLLYRYGVCRISYGTSDLPPSFDAFDGHLTLPMRSDLAPKADILRLVREDIWNALSIATVSLDDHLTDDAKRLLSRDQLEQLMRIASWDVRSWTPEDHAALDIRGRSISIRLSNPIHVGDHTYEAVRLKSNIANGLLPPVPLPYTEAFTDFVGRGGIRETGKPAAYGAMSRRASDNETITLQALHGLNEPLGVYPLGSLVPINHAFLEKPLAIEVGLIRHWQELRAFDPEINNLWPTAALLDEKMKTIAYSTGEFLARLQQRYGRSWGAASIDQVALDSPSLKIFFHDFEASHLLPSEDFAMAVTMRVWDIGIFLYNLWSWYIVPRRGVFGYWDIATVEALGFSIENSFLAGFQKTIQELTESPATCLPLEWQHLTILRSREFMDRWSPATKDSTNPLIEFLKMAETVRRQDMQKRGRAA